MSLATWAASMLVPSGDLAGQPWTVLAWQRKLFAAIEGDAEVIAVSCARGNGKTAVAALIARAFLPGGPLYAPGREVLVVSASHHQARLIMEDLEAWVPEDRAGWLISNNNALARVKAGKATVRALAARHRGLHGARPDLVIGDEIAQWNQPERMFAALRTSLGKRTGARLVALGTRPEAGSGHVFDRLLQGGADVALNYAATEADEKAGRLGWRRTWRKANPSLLVLPSLEASLVREWAEARIDEQALARFKSLRLNMGTSETAESVLVAPEAWKRCEVDSLPEQRGGYCLGVDLGGTRALSAAAAYWPATGSLRVLAAVGGVPDLRERERRTGPGGRTVRDDASPGRADVVRGEADSGRV